jgi:hypothetical protein
MILIEDNADMIDKADGMDLANYPSSDHSYWDSSNFDSSYSGSLDLDSSYSDSSYWDPSPSLSDHVVSSSSYLDSSEDLRNCQIVDIQDIIPSNFGAQIMDVSYIDWASIAEVEGYVRTCMELASDDYSFLCSAFGMDYYGNYQPQMVVFPLIFFLDHKFTFPIHTNPIINQIIHPKSLDHRAMIKNLKVSCFFMIFYLHFPFPINFLVTRVKS